MIEDGVMVSMFNEFVKVEKPMKENRKKETSRSKENQKTGILGN